MLRVKLESGRQLLVARRRGGKCNAFVTYVTSDGEEFWVPTKSVVSEEEVLYEGEGEANVARGDLMPDAQQGS